MNQQQFEQEPAPRAQRMTEDEAKAVIDLWQRECTESGGLTTSPAVEDVAEGLDISVDDVQRLLQKVRAQRLDEDEIHLEKQRLADEEHRLIAVRLEWEKARRRQREREGFSVEQPALYLRPIRSLPLTRGISPPPANELMETTQREARIKAEGRRVSRYVLAAIAAVAILAHLLAWFFH